MKIMGETLLGYAFLCLAVHINLSIDLLCCKLMKGWTGD